MSEIIYAGYKVPTYQAHLFENPYDIPDSIGLSKVEALRIRHAIKAAEYIRRHLMKPFDGVPIDDTIKYGIVCDFEVLLLDGMQRIVGVLNYSSNATSENERIVNPYPN